MSSLPLAVVTALPSEAGVLRRALSQRRALESPVDVWCGSLAGSEITLAITGPGRERAAIGVRDLLTRVEVGRLLALGFGGGLVADLHPGDIVAGAEVIDPGGNVLPADPILLETATSLLPEMFRLRGGRIVTVEDIVGRACDKTQLGAHTGADVVDMESASIARVAAEHGVPALCARCIIDESHRELPSELASLIDERGRPRPLRVARFLARHPQHLSLLRELGRLSQLGARHLEWLVKRIIEQLPENSP